MVDVLVQPTSEGQSVSTLVQTTEGIRAGHAEDVEILGALWLYQRNHHKQWDKRYATLASGQEEWKDFIKACLDQSNHCILVAEDWLGRVIGYIHGSFYPWPMSPNEYYGSLNTIAINPEAQGQGIGKKLVQALLDWFREENIQHISVHVDYRNRIALRLYKKLGFQSYQYRLMIDLESSSPP
ncbi:MAG: GNAT family N-acetyltransferase [Candidatus Hodarchaeota archaeon]